MSSREILGGIAINLIAFGIVSYLKGPSAGAISLAVGLPLLLGIYMFQKRKPAPPLPGPTQTQEFKPELHQSFNPQFNPQHNIYIGISNPKSIAAEARNTARGTTLIHYLTSAHPTIAYELREISWHLSISLPEARDIMEKLTTKNVVFRDKLDQIEGGVVYFLDELYRPQPSVFRSKDWTAEWTDSEAQFRKWEKSDVFGERYDSDWMIRSDRMPQAKIEVEVACELAGARLSHSPNLALSERVRSQTEHKRRWLYFLEESEGFNGVIEGFGGGYIQNLALVSARACVKCKAKVFG